MDGFFTKVAKRYAKEVAIASLEKAIENAKVKYTLDEELNKHYLIDKSSITNVENIEIVNYGK